jgi:cyclopropane-fatty-acyl-phospholipid synthase
MSMIERTIRAAETAPLPDFVLRHGVSFLVDRTRRMLADRDPGFEARFAAEMDRFPIAEHASAANEQHYEVPAEFFALVLGPRRKYSSCLYESGADTLQEAEIRALAETVEHAQLEDGQSVLELGCGWGSLSLFMAERYPASRIVSVSNSASQRAYIESEAAARGLTNLSIITRDMNAFETAERFDRVVSVEMFEHMANWRALLSRVKTWLKPDGRLFIHIFTHRAQPYRFDHNDKGDWIAQHFFTGGIMPSHGLIRHFGDLFTLEEEWKWNGCHYSRTAEDWLANFDRNGEAVDRVLRAVYRDAAPLWRRRWRLFFLATSGLFGHANGDEWGVSHYRLRPAD